MKNISVFNFFDNKNIKLGTVEYQGAKWINALDAIKILGFDIATAKKILRREGGGKITHVSNGNYILQEQDLYTLALQSESPAGIAFTDWVTEEVLPSLNRTGGYIHGKTIKEIQENAISTLKAKLESIKKKEDEIPEIQKVNAILIQMDVSFDDRRVKLQDYFKKHILPLDTERGLLH